MSPNDYASTWLTILTLSALGLGTVAMLVRWLFRVQRERPHLARDFVADVKRGEGFTFYKTPPAVRHAGSTPTDCSPRMVAPGQRPTR